MVKLVLFFISYTPRQFPLRVVVITIIQELLFWFYGWREVRCLCWSVREGRFCRQWEVLTSYLQNSLCMWDIHLYPMV